MITTNETCYRALSEQERAVHDARCDAHARAMSDAGIVCVSALLQSTESATTVRKRDGARMVLDGPFGEQDEQLSEIAIIEVADLDEALAWAARHPSTECGSVEVRPVRRRKRCRTPPPSTTL